jgi:hypothetical protein
MGNSVALQTSASNPLFHTFIGILGRPPKKPFPSSQQLLPRNKKKKANA